MRILIADDDVVSRVRLEAMMRKAGYDVVVANDGLEAWRILQSDDAPRFAVLDWLMPGMDGLQICREARARVGHPYVYILLLTAKDRKEDLVEGLEAGADDYIIKPFHNRELEARLRAGKRIVELQEELIASREIHWFQATHDDLTGLWSRRSILEILDRELARSRRERTALGVVMADIDHFKRINDERGHLVGDQVLKEVARRMRAAVRPYDSIGRYGGEEFLILLPGCGVGEALGLAERIRTCLCEAPFGVSAGNKRERLELAVTGSLGVTAWGSEEEIDADTLIRAADNALYRAKGIPGEGGRNRAVLGEAPEAMRPVAGSGDVQETRTATTSDGDMPNGGPAPAGRVIAPARETTPAGGRDVT